MEYLRKQHATFFFCFVFALVAVPVVGMRVCTLIHFFHTLRAGLVTHPEHKPAFYRLSSFFLFDGSEFVDVLCIGYCAPTSVSYKSPPQMDRTTEEYARE